MKADTRTALLDRAQELAQTRGLTGFSFRDLAEGLGIRPASVHHHFPTKADLGRELMARYRAEFAEALTRIEKTAGSPLRRLEQFGDLFGRTLANGNRLCLCGMLATEFAKLPSAVQDEVRGFYTDTEAWLTRTLADGMRDGTMRFDGPATVVASTMLSALEGAMIAARTFGDQQRLAGSLGWMLTSLTAPARPGTAG